LESTYVCTAPLFQSGAQEIWENSRVWQKLQRVLWVPIIYQAGIAPKERKIGSAILWSPDQKIAWQLKKDWEELTEMLYLGKIQTIYACFGSYFHIRPKVAQ